VPALVKVAELENSQWRRWYQQAYRRLSVSWRRYLPAPRSSVQVVNHAVFVLGFFGADARPAVSTLARLSERGEEFLRYNAIIALGRIGPEAKDVVPVLLLGLGATNQTYLRLAAVQVLAKIDVAGDLSAPTLATLLSDGNEAVASATLVTLAGMARHSPHLVSNLWTALRDSRVQVCSAAANELKNRDALTRESIEPFLQELESPHAVTRFKAASVLVYSGKFAPDVVPKLLLSARP
jgi:HEAT repeat protein